MPVFKPEGGGSNQGTPTDKAKAGLKKIRDMSVTDSIVNGFRGARDALRQVYTFLYPPIINKVIVQTFNAVAPKDKHKDEKQNYEDTINVLAGLTTVITIPYFVKTIVAGLGFFDDLLGVTSKLSNIISGDD